MRERKAVEVRVHWGDDLLEVEHVSQERAAEIGRRLAGGPLRCEVRSVVVAEAFGAAKMDRAPWFYVGGSLAFAGSLLLAASFLPPSTSTLTVDRSELASRNVRSLLMEELPREVEAPAASTYEGDVPVLADGDAGRAGTRDAPVRRRRREATGEREPEADHGQRSVEVGALAALRSLRGSWSSQSPFAGPAGGHDALASLMGDRVGESFGFGGLTLSSTGRGAGVEGGTQPVEGFGMGGTGSGTCGCGEAGYLGVGHGTAGLVAARRVEPELQPRESHVPERIVRCGCADLRARGSLSREVIRRVVRRHHQEVRHCYERGLQSRPDLEGRVLTRFTIAPSGEVVASVVESSSVGHAATETCIARAARRWSFPASEEGGITNVTYPFVLESL